MRNTFSKYERLKSEQHIDTLFRTGKAYSIFPLKFIFLSVSRGAEQSPVRVGFSVPKKKFRKSVQRHRVRRILFEAWRLQKSTLYDFVQPDNQLHLFILCVSTQTPTGNEVSMAISKYIEHMQKSLSV